MYSFRWVLHFFIENLLKIAWAALRKISVESDPMCVSKEIFTNYHTIERGTNILKMLMLILVKEGRDRKRIIRR